MKLLEIRQNISAQSPERGHYSGEHVSNAPYTKLVKLAVHPHELGAAVLALTVIHTRKQAAIRGLGSFL